MADLPSHLTAHRILIGQKVKCNAAGWTGTVIGVSGDRLLLECITPNGRVFECERSIDFSINWLTKIKEPSDASADNQTPRSSDS